MYKIRRIDYSKIEPNFDLLHITFPNWHGKDMDKFLEESQRQVLLENWLSLIRKCKQYGIPVTAKLYRQEGAVNPNPLDDYDVSGYVKPYTDKHDDGFVIELLNNRHSSNRQPISIFGGVHFDVFSFPYSEEFRLECCVTSSAERARVLSNNTITAVIDPNLCAYPTLERKDGFRSDVLYKRSSDKWKETSYEDVYRVPLDKLTI